MAVRRTCHKWSHADTEIWVLSLLYYLLIRTFRGLAFEMSHSSPSVPCSCVTACLSVSTVSSQLCDQAHERSRPHGSQDMPCSMELQEPGER